jgi:hypothetical protein
MKDATGEQIGRGDGRNAVPLGCSPAARSALARYLTTGLSATTPTRERAIPMCGGDTP